MATRTRKPAARKAVEVPADGSLSEPITSEGDTALPEITEAVVGAHGEKVEAVGSGSGAKGFYVYECSGGDFISRVSAAEVEAHIAALHGTAKD